MGISCQSWKRSMNGQMKLARFGNEECWSPCCSDSEHFALIVHQKQLLLASWTWHEQETTTGTSQHFTHTHRHRNDKPPFYASLDVTILSFCKNVAQGSFFPFEMQPYRGQEGESEPWYCLKSQANVTEGTGKVISVKEQTCRIFWIILSELLLQNVFI